MTPTEQDKELRKAVWASLASQMTHAINCTDPEHKRQDSCVDFTEKNFEQLMQLITADRKRVALEARLQEVEVSVIELERSDDPRFYSKDEAIRSQRARYTQLKAQQEEV